MNSENLMALSDGISVAGFEISGLKTEYTLGEPTGDYWIRISPARDPDVSESLQSRLSRELKSLQAEIVGSPA